MVVETQLRRDERDTYLDMWEVAPYAAYSPGEECAAFFQPMTNARPGSRVLDAGCGQGRGGLALQGLGYRVAYLDLVDVRLDAAKDVAFYEASVWDDLREVVEQEVDWVYCCDVMEHLPTEMTMLAIARFLEVAQEGVFLSISHQPDAFGAYVGRPLHQTVKSFVWWRDRLREMGTILGCRDRLSSGLFAVARTRV